MTYQDHLKKIIADIKDMPLENKVDALNEIRESLHDISPFKNEPVDFVRWVKNERVVANDYNPNKVAPPEMQLLEVSIINDGYTQPIVTFPNEENVEVVDGFHRNRVGKESFIVKERVKGFLPVVSIRSEKQDKSSRIASTIRHNRARGKHQVSAMSEIVIELKNRNWKNERIARELGMDEDEILRLCQISGLENLFKDSDFGKAWVSPDENMEIYEFTDEVSEEDMSSLRIPNEKDTTRIFHHFSKWENVEYDFFATRHKEWDEDTCKSKYTELMTDLVEFERVLILVTSEWRYACEQNLTNKSLNRIAWLGQASMSYKYKIPAIYSSGWQLLDDDQKHAANEVALKVLNDWLLNNNLEQVSLNDGLQVGRQVELY